MNTSKHHDVSGMIFYYIHGFNSAPGGNTGEHLSRLLSNLRQLEYHSAKTYEDNMASLKRQVAPAKSALFIGTSLGGFYASQLASSRIVPHLKALLINPAIYPEKTLIKWIGKNINFRTGEEYELTPKVIDSYRTRLDLVSEKSHDIPRIILLADHDEVLDHTETREFWKGYGDIRTFHGGHRISDYELIAATAKELQDSSIAEC